MILRLRGIAPSEQSGARKGYGQLVLPAGEKSAAVPV